MGGRKNTPVKDRFFENETLSLLTGEVSQSSQDSFCNDESHEFLQLSRLLYTINYIDNIANVKKLMLIQATLLHGSILENRLHHSRDRKYPRNLILI